MTGRHSLRIRVTRTFALFAATVSLIWGLAGIAGMRLTEDRVIARQLQLVAQDYAIRFTPQNEELTPHSSYLDTYDDAAALPAALTDWAMESPAPGYYEFPESELHVAVLSADTTARPRFIVFDVAGIEAASSEDWWWFGGLAAVVTLLTTVAVGIGTALSRRVIEPVTRLADIVEQLNPEELSDEAQRAIGAMDFEIDEIGLLAGTIETTLQRISLLIEREKSFTSAASHELRTPVTVISGALELLEQSNLENRDARAVARIKRATDDMRTTIEVFLCLAREPHDGLYNEFFSVSSLVHQAINQHRYLLENKQIAVDVKSSSNPEIFGHSQAFAIAVNNLVRNAFEHTPHGHGPISIRIDDTGVSVTNRRGASSGESNQLDSSRISTSGAHGYGLGLNIVERLCEHNGWTFSLDTHNNMVDASLSWSTSTMDTGSSGRPDSRPCASSKLGRRPPYT